MHACSATMQRSARPFTATRSFAQDGASCRIMTRPATCCRHVKPLCAAQQGTQPAAASTSAFAVDRRALLLGLSSISLAAALPLPAALAGDIKTVFVAGATGNTGRRVVRELRARGYKVKAGVRDVKKAQSLGFALDSGIEIVQADISKGTELLRTAINGSDAVISALGYNGFNPGGFGAVDETGTISLIDAAKAAGVQHFVLLSSLLTNAKAVNQTNNPNYKFLNLFGGVLDHKLVAERYLRGVGIPEWTIVRPGGLSHDPPEAVGKLIVSKEDTLFGLDTDPGREISRDTVAQVLVAALEETSADNKVVEIVASKNAPDLPQSQWFP